MKNKIEIPEGWEVKKLGNLSKIKMGQSPSSENYNNEGNGIYLIQGNADCKNRKTKPRNWTTQVTKTCDIGDVIMTVRAPVGTISRCLHNACIGRGVCAIKSNNKNDYLYHYLVRYERLWNKLAQGTTFEAVSSNEIKNLRLIVPKSKKEQQKISTILSKLDQNIEKTEQAIEKYKKIKNGLMDDLLTGKIRIKNGKWVKETEFKEVEGVGKVPNDWEVNEIRSLLEGTPKYGANETALDYNSYFARYLRITDISYEGKLLNIEKKSIDSNSAKEYILRQDEIVIARTGNTVGKSYIYREEDGVLAYAGYLIKFKFDKNRANANYIFQILHFSEYYRWIGNTLRIGAQPNINSEEYCSMIIRVPSLNEQDNIIEVLSKQDNLIEKEQQYLQKLKKLKAGLMEDLLTGKVRVKLDN